MRSPVYGFLLNMWIMGKVDEEKLFTYVPKFITQEEYEMIIVTPQGDGDYISSQPVEKEM